MARFSPYLRYLPISEQSIVLSEHSWPYWLLFSTLLTRLQERQQ